MFTHFRKLSFCLAALVLGAAAAHAQGAGGAAVSIGYSNLRSNAPPGQCGCFYMNGFNVAFAAGVGHGFSLVADVDRYHKSDVNGTGTSLTVVNYLFGPRVSYRRSKHWTPFAQFLLGGAHGSETLYATTSNASGSANGFAMSAGGGLDWNASRHLSFRLFQMEYLNTRLPNSVNGVQNNFRLTTGLVFHFGRR